jgi:hypothetical protein
LSVGTVFAVALFVAGLAFTDPLFQTQAKIGILGGSVVAGPLGLTVLAQVTKTKEPEQESTPGQETALTEESAEPPGRSVNSRRKVKAPITV